MKDNSHKKRTWEDKFIKHWCCSAENHPQGWSWWKRRNRKLNRKILKNELNKEDQNI